MADSKERNARSSTVSDLLIRLGSELGDINSTDSRVEQLARLLWTLSLNKEVELPSGEIVRLDNNLWVQVIFRVIERMEGKPMQPLSAEVSGVTINRQNRLAKLPPDASPNQILKTDNQEFHELNRQMAEIAGRPQQIIDVVAE